MKLPIWTRHLRPVVAGGALFLLTSACYATLQPATEATVWVAVGPPSPQYEVRPASPGPEFIWIVGYSQWSGSAYTWAPGRWERRPTRARRGSRAAGTTSAAGGAIPKGAGTTVTARRPTQTGLDRGQVATPPALLRCPSPSDH